MNQDQKNDILSGETDKIKRGVLRFLRDGRRAYAEDGDHANRWHTRFVGEYTGGSILLPYRETAELIDDGVIEIDDQYRLRLTAGGVI